MQVRPPLKRGPEGPMLVIFEVLPAAPGEQGTSRRKRSNLLLILQRLRTAAARNAATAVSTVPSSVSQGRLTLITVRDLPTFT